jgi:hypothetical protein
MKLRMLLVVACLLIGSAWKPATCRAQAEVLPDHFELTNVEPLAQQVNGVTWELDRGQLRGGGTPGVSTSSFQERLSGPNPLPWICLRGQP